MTSIVSDSGLEPLHCQPLFQLLFLLFSPMSGVREADLS